MAEGLSCVGFNWDSLYVLLFLLLVSWLPLFFRGTYFSPVSSGERSWNETCCEEEKEPAKHARIVSHTDEMLEGDWAWIPWKWRLGVVSRFLHAHWI